MSPSTTRTRSSARGGTRAGAGRPRDLDSAAGVLAKTLALLEKRGYEGVSVDGVAAAARVAKTTIYRHWRSKPELVAAAAAPLFAELDEVPAGDDVRQELGQLLGSARRLMSGRAGRVLKILLRESASHPALADVVQPALHRRRRTLVQVLTRAVARGELRADIDQEMVADLLLGPLWVRMLVTPAPLSSDLVPQLVEAVLRGVRR